MSLRDDIVTRIRNVPPLSRTARRIITGMSRRDRNAAELVRIIETDAQLTARVLAAARATCTDGRGATTVEAVMESLGDRVVFGIALDYCTNGQMHCALDGYEAGPGELWEHNLMTAVTARTAARMCSRDVSPAEAFTGGMLHDIGKTVISDFLKGAGRDTAGMIDTGAAGDYLAAEEKLLGTNHCITGAVMAEFWKLPSPLPEIIRHHHHPLAAATHYQALVFAVHAGDIISMMKGCGTGIDALCYRLQPGLKEVLGLRKDQLPALMLQADEEYRAICGRLNTEVSHEKHTACR